MENKIELLVVDTTDLGLVRRTTLVPNQSSHHYIPVIGEPSPFGPDQQNYVDNPWIVWKHNQPNYNEINEGSASLLREALIDLIKRGPVYIGDVLQHIPYEMEGDNGKVALGWVIHMYFNLGNKTWEEVHAVGQARIDHPDHRKQSNQE
jgi:hypothetical protein